MMKSFKQYIKEETMPYAVTASGSINIDDPAVLDGLNSQIAGVTSGKFVTPYIAYERVQKALANFLIFPARPSFFQNDSGMYMYPINQFGDKFGQREDGTFVKDGEVEKDLTHGPHIEGEQTGMIQKPDTTVEEKHTLYFEWRQSDCGMFNIFCEIVTQDELDEILADLEAELNDEEDDDDELNEEKFTNRVPSANPYGNLDATKKEMNRPKPVPTRKTDDLDNMNRDAEGNTVVEEEQIDEVSKNNQQIYHKVRQGVMANENTTVTFQKKGKKTVDFDDGWQAAPSSSKGQKEVKKVGEPIKEDKNRDKKAYEDGHKAWTDHMSGKNNKRANLLTINYYFQFTMKPLLYHVKTPN
jgi:hypothetical protein